MCYTVRVHIQIIKTLLVRTALAALALLLLVGAYGNREFWTEFPFSIQTIIDVLLAAALLYTAIRFTYCIQHKKRFTRTLVAATAVYIVATQAVSLWYYVHELGVDYIAQSYGSFTQFLVAQAALDVGVPVVLLGVLYYSAYVRTR